MPISRLGCPLWRKLNKFVSDSIDAARTLIAAHFSSGSFFAIESIQRFLPSSLGEGRKAQERRPTLYWARLSRGVIATKEGSLGPRTRSARNSTDRKSAIERHSLVLSISISPFICVFLYSPSLIANFTFLFVGKRAVFKAARLAVIVIFKDCRLLA
jgi:hypothetical protein